MHTTITTPVLAPTYSSPSRMNITNRSAQDSPRYYDNTPSGGHLIYSNPEFPQNSTTALVSDPSYREN